MMLRRYHDTDTTKKPLVEKKQAVIAESVEPATTEPKSKRSRRIKTDVVNNG